MQSSHRFELHGRQVGYQIFGDPQKPLCLGLHGWLDNSSTFQRLSELLPDFSLLAIDLPGHGETDSHPPGIRYHFIDSVAFVFETVNALGWKEFSILGHSMGAGIGVLMAGAEPHRIQKLVLIEGTGPMTRPAEESAEGFESAFKKHKAVRPSKETIFPDWESLVRMRMKAGNLSYEASEILMKRGVDKVDAGFRLRRDIRLTTPSLLRLTEEMVLSFLKRIQCPTLLITGAESEFDWNSEFQKNRISAISQLEHSVLPGRHHLHLEIPEPVAKAISSFWS